MNASLTLEMLDRKVEGHRESIVARFGTIDERMDEEFLFVRAGFARMDNEFEYMHAKFDQMDKGFERMDKSIESVEKGFRYMHEQFSRVDERFDTMQAKIDDFILMIQRIFMAKGQNPFAEGSDIGE